METIKHIYYYLQTMYRLDPQKVNIWAASEHYDGQKDIYWIFLCRTILYHSISDSDGSDTQPVCGE